MIIDNCEIHGQVCYMLLLPEMARYKYIYLKYISFEFRMKDIPTIECSRHLNMYGVWVKVFSSECAEDGRVCFCSVWIAGLRRAALQREVAVSRVYERVLAQAVEGVLEAVEGTDVWVPVEPTCGCRHRGVLASTVVYIVDLPETHSYVDIK